MDKKQSLLASIKKEDVLELLENDYELYYVDYNDSLSDEHQQMVIRDENFEGSIYDFWDNVYDEPLKNLREKLIENYPTIIFEKFRKIFRFTNEKEAKEALVSLIINDYFILNEKEFNFNDIKKVDFYLGNFLEKLYQKLDGNSKFYIESISTDYEKMLKEKHYEFVNKLREYSFNHNNNVFAYYDCLETDVDILINEYQEEIINTISSRDSSSPLQGLIKNTGQVPLFYSLGYETSYPDIKEERLEKLDEIKKILKITDDKYDDNILSLLNEAFYGGELRIYFSDTLDEWTVHKNLEYKSIKFDGDVVIALIDSGNGSGWHEKFENFELTVEFKLENLFVDRATHYNYTDDIAGMYSNWCEGSLAYGLKSIDDNIQKIETSSMNAHLEQEAKYDETFKNGSCTPGDMNIRRHRDVFYRNEYPAGNKCPHCGTFWVD